MILATVLVACGGQDSSAPTENIGLDVTLTASQVQGPLIIDKSPAPSEVSCVVSLSAIASGSGAATWQGGKVRYYGVANRAILDSISFGATEIRQSWGSVTIGSSQTQYGKWSISYVAPFAAEIEMSYQVGAIASVLKTTKTMLTCAPPGAGTSPPPVISSLVVSPSNGSYNVGTPLVVSYNVSSPSGIWSSGVRVSGACSVDQTFVEDFRIAVTRTVNLALPASCVMGAPVRVSVVATDGAAQVSSLEHGGTLALVDQLPPTITAQFLWHSDFGASVGSDFHGVPSGEYASGPANAVVAAFDASDNHRLAAIVWEALPFGVKDSLIVTGGVGRSTPLVSMRLRPEWTGSVQFRIHARDASGLTSAPITTPRDSIRVVATVTRPTRVATISGEVRTFAIDSRRQLIYIAQTNEYQLAVFSMASGQVVATLPLTTTPRDLDLTPSGDTLLVTLFGKGLGIVDLRQPTLSVTPYAIAGLDASKGQTPSSILSLRNGHTFVTTDGHEPAAFALLDINLATGAQRERFNEATSGLRATGMQRSLDHRVAVLGQSTTGAPQDCLRRYVVDQDVFSPCTTPRFRMVPTLDSTGTRSASAWDVFDAEMRRLPSASPQLAKGSNATALSADGKSLYVAMGTSGLVRINAETGHLIDTMAMPIASSDAIRVSPDGKTLVVVSGAGRPSATIVMIPLP